MKSSTSVSSFCSAASSAAGRDLFVGGDQADDELSRAGAALRSARSSSDTRRVATWMSHARGFSGTPSCGPLHARP